MYVEESSALTLMDLEYRLTIATRIDCWCGRYLIGRREVLLPELYKSWVEQKVFPDSVDVDPEDFVHAFMVKLHEKKCPTMEQPEPFADQVVRHIRDTIGDDPEPEEYPVDETGSSRKPFQGLPRPTAG